jgi:5-methylcytosine-specific restriction endonuclease McrA
LKVENPEWKAKEDARRLFNYTNNYPKHWASRQASRAKKAGSSGIISWEEWQELLKEHDGKCHWCGLKLHPSFMSLDHVQPLCRGGLNIKANAVPSCINCNHQRKWYDELKYPEIYKKHYGACEAVEEQVAA